MAFKFRFERIVQFFDFLPDIGKSGFKIIINFSPQTVFQFFVSHCFDSTSGYSRHCFGVYFDAGWKAIKKVKKACKNLRRRNAPKKLCTPRAETVKEIF
jgi:hypothetical protein